MCSKFLNRCITEKQGHILSIGMAEIGEIYWLRIKDKFYPFFEKKIL